MVNKDLRELLVEIYGQLVFFESPSFDNAIIGITSDNRVVYDFDTMVEELMRDDGLEMEEADDCICSDTIRSLSYYGSTAPIVVFGIKKMLGDD